MRARRRGSRGIDSGKAGDLDETDEWPPAPHSASLVGLGAIGIWPDGGRNAHSGIKTCSFFVTFPHNLVLCYIGRVQVLYTHFCYSVVYLC